MSMYLRFGAVLLISLALMFLLSLSLIRTLDHFYLSPSNFYMALLMVLSMGAVMLLGMQSMFSNRRANVALLIGFAVLFAGIFALGRTETFVGNRGFLLSMIPHHSRAILMCEEADISDPQIATLCDAIVETQQREIDEMKGILERY